MDKRNLNHTALAYLVLGIVLWCFWSLVISPIAGRWQQHKLQSEELQRDIDRFGSNQVAAQTSSDALHRHLAALVKQGKLSPETNASATSHQLQQQAKQALLLASATVLEMRPSSLIESPWLRRNQLDVSFRIASSELETLLHALAQQMPRLHLELLSLREPMRGAANSLQLEARATLGLWNPSNSLIQLMTTSLTPTERSAESASDTPGPPELAGLFDAAQRARIQNPNAKHYRLTAVTVSADVRIAVIADLLAGTSRRLREGDQLDAWKVQLIEADGVTLQRGKLNARLKLQSK